MLISSPRSRRRFLNEITTTANLQHSNILPLHDSGGVNGMVWYVMPLVEGESLRSRASPNSRLTTRAARRHYRSRVANSVSIVNVGYRSTNFWVLSAGRSRLLVDLGWMGMFAALEAELKRKNVPLEEIAHGFATHFHGDHAGAAQDFKNRGMRLIVTPEQVPHIQAMKQWMKPVDDYTEIRLDDNVVVPLAESRAFLKSIGFDGQLVHTPGHSDDSVTLLLDTGEAFTGDLTHPHFITEETAGAVTASWDRLRALGAKTVYAGHGPVRPMPSALQSC